MMRWTSMKCYREIKESGFLSQSRMQVWQALVDFEGPATAGELANTPNMAIVMSRNNLIARLRELVRMGIVQELPDHRKCSITNMMCMVFDIRDAPPVKLEIPLTTKQLNQDLMAENETLRARIDKLQSELELLRGDRQVPLFEMVPARPGC